MTPDKMRILITSSVGLIIAVIAGWWATNHFYLAPRAEKLEEIERFEGMLETAENEFDRGIAANDRLQRYADRTLGTTLEEVDHGLRARLNRITEELKLASVVVSTGRGDRQGTPARRVFSGSAKRSFRDQIDFVELTGNVSAEGTLEQIIALTDHIEAEPWIKRIDGMSVTPKNNGERFSVTVRLTTLFLPGFTPEAIESMPYDNARMAEYAAVMHRNPFRVPPPPAPVVATEEPEPAPQNVEKPKPPAFPYHQWGMTAVAETMNEIEVWLLNRNSGESRRLAVGDRVGDAVLVSATGEYALFELKEARFKVVVGTTLGDRLPPG